MSKYGYDDTRRTRFRRLLLGMGVAMLLFFLLLKIFFAEQLPFTSLHWKLIFGYFLLLSVAVLVYPVFRKMRDQDRWSIQNGAIEIEEGVLHLSVVRGRETRRLNVEIKNLKIVTSDDVRIRIDTPVGQLTISADKFVTPEEYASFQEELIYLCSHKSGIFASNKRYIAGWSSWQLVGLITRRSEVRVLLPLLKWTILSNCPLFLY